MSIERKPVVISKKNFKEFIKYCKHYIEVFGLRDWDITFAHSEDLYQQGSLANTTFNTSSHMATIRLATKKWCNIMPNEIKKAALHECGHIWIGVLHELATKRYVQTEDTIDDEIERLLISLENILIGNDKDAILEGA